ncbi:putative protein isoform X1 [Capsicum galapagoense]
MLLDDDFGWDKRLKVATQLADLFSWLHMNGIAVGSVTTACIMIDDVNLNPCQVIQLVDPFRPWMQGGHVMIVNLMTVVDFVSAASGFLF